MWKDVDPDLRLGLSLREFKKVCGKYREVIIVPIVQGNRFLGALPWTRSFRHPRMSCTEITLQVKRYRWGSCGHHGDLFGPSLSLDIHTWLSDETPVGDPSGLS